MLCLVSQRVCWILLKQCSVKGKQRFLPRGEILSWISKPNYSANLGSIETGRNNLPQVAYSSHFVLRKNNLSGLEQPLASIQRSHIPLSHDLPTDLARSESHSARPWLHLCLTGLDIWRAAFPFFLSLWFLLLLFTVYKFESTPDTQFVC